MPRLTLLIQALVLVHGCADSITPDLGTDASLDDDAAPIGDDAAPLDDAAVVADQDAFSCPGYASTVQPIYAHHCSSCHTTGPDTRFGSSISVARSQTSACGTTMLTCTIELGRRGGQMSYNDPYGGFSAAEVATLQAWGACGMPD